MSLVQFYGLISQKNEIKKTNVWNVFRRNEKAVYQPLYCAYYYHPINSATFSHVNPIIGSIVNKFHFK